jgi:type II secretory pathway predicted ATPase ExeA
MERIITTSILVSRVLAGRAFLVKTPACIEYYTKLKSWFSMGIQGAIVVGRPRLGKTSGTRWVLGAIQMVFGKVPYVEIPIRKQHLHNEGAFFQFMLKCCKHKYYNRGSVADKRDRLFEALLARARRSSIRMVILFIDEAQELEELHYQWLRNISNELDSAGYRIFCLLVGQKELINKRNSLLVEEMEQIVSRFMTEVLMFSGDRKSTRLNSSHNSESRMPSSA